MREGGYEAVQSVAGLHGGAEAHAPICGQCLSDDLIHIVIPVIRQPPDERHLPQFPCELLVTLEKVLIFGARNGIVGVTLGGRVFIAD